MPEPFAASDDETPALAAAAPFHLSQEPLGTGQPAHPVEPATRDGGTSAAPAYEHLGELPASYGTQSVYLVAYDPHQLFAYWDLDPIEAADKKYSLRVCRPDGETESEVDIDPAEAGRYLAATRPNGTYYVELGSYSRAHHWEVLATSGRVTLPAEGLSGEAEPKFATLPFHLSFQRLLELIDGAVGSKEDLTLALARLQHGEKPAVSSMLGALSRLSSEQVHTLGLVLGQQFAANSESTVNTGGLDRFARDRQEAITSPGQSSDLFSGIGAPGSEALSSFSLSSGAVHAPFSSGTMHAPFSSGSFSSLGAGFGSEALTSREFGSEALTSGGFGSESLLSLLSGLGSDTLASFFSAFGGGSESLSSGVLGAGTNSEAWRMAANAPGLSGSDLLSSERAAMFLHAVESNLDVLSSLFSHTFSTLQAGSSPTGGSGSLGGPGGGGGSESFAKKKSLW